MQCSVECAFVSVGCSIGPSRVDWGKTYVAFCQSRNIYLLQSQLGDVPAHTLNSGAFHRDSVTCLRWMVHDAEATDYLLSSALDGDVILWLAESGRLEPIAHLKQTERYTSAIAGLWIEDMKSSFIVGCGNRSGLQFWKDCAPTHYIDYEGGPPICCDIRAVDAGVLAVSGHTDYVCRIHFIKHGSDTWTSLALADSCQDWLCSVKFSLTHSSFYLAGGSRDHTIKIWKVYRRSKQGQQKCKIVTKELPIYETEHETCFVALETVIASHMEAVTSVCWNPKGKYQLLSSSMDKSIMFWSYNEESDRWEEQGVIGHFGGVEVGFYCAVFSPNGSSVVALGYNGCLHCWTLTESCWRPTFMPTGHFSSVEDIAWEPHGLYLLSCSIDKSTRLFGEWNISSLKKTFCEIARPQVHGYEVHCLSFLSSEMFVCGAAEKVLRVFVAPLNFVLNLWKHTDISATVIGEMFHSNARSAAVAALGLTNRPVYNDAVLHGTTSEDTNENEITLEHGSVAEPPDNDYLAKNTLWPEDQKLYGHGFEIFSVASNHAGTVLASSCRASRPEHAVVILWSLGEGVPKNKLSGHRLTVTRIAFSPDDALLLTVSRDRKWCLFKKQTEDFDYTAVLTRSAIVCSHTRVIWDCAWAPCKSCFFTASRDKRVIGWQFRLDENEQPKMDVVRTSAMVFDDPVTAVDVLPFQVPPGNLLAVGLESGTISLLLWSPNTELQLLKNVSQSTAHSLMVKRLRFCPRLERSTVGDSAEVRFASCSADGCVKIYDVSLDWGFRAAE